MSWLGFVPPTSCTAGRHTTKELSQHLMLFAIQNLYTKCISCSIGIWVQFLDLFEKTKSLHPDMNAQSNFKTHLKIFFAFKAVSGTFGFKVCKGATVQTQNFSLTHKCNIGNKKRRSYKKAYLEKVRGPRNKQY
jgi:hypothetical protein